MQRIEGQWLGNYAGTNSGLAILNLDRRPGGFWGSGVMLEGNAGLPSGFYTVTLAPSGQFASKGQAQLVRHFRTHDGRTRWIPKEEVAREFPVLVKAATKIDMNVELRNGFLSLEFITDAGTYGHANLERWPKHPARSERLAGLDVAEFAAATAKSAVSMAALSKSLQGVS